MIKTISYAPGPMDNSMQAQVRQSLADKEQNDLYTKMHSKVGATIDSQFSHSSRANSSKCKNQRQS